MLIDNWKPPKVKGSKKPQINRNIFFMCDSYLHSHFALNVGINALLCLSFCNPMDHSSPSSSVHGILQAKILEWVAISFSRDLSKPGLEPLSLVSPALAGRFFTTSTTWEALNSPSKRDHLLVDRGNDGHGFSPWSSLPGRTQV